jgi:hypothetical protein
MSRHLHLWRTAHLDQNPGFPRCASYCFKIEFILPPFEPLNFRVGNVLEEVKGRVECIDA